MQRNDLLVWVDLEMTSLVDVQKDQIIEISAIITDKDLRVVAEGPDIAIHAAADAFEKITPELKAFHQKSGAYDAAIASTVTLKEAEEQILTFVQEWVAPNSSPLCGNSIHTDRHFLRVQMPKFEEYLFYRCIDVSTCKELARRWAPEVYAEAERRKEHKSHRAKADILQSIDELRFYREKLFKI